MGSGNKNNDIQIPVISTKEVKDELDKSGFSMEMRIARKMHQLSAFVVQGQYWMDGDGIPRETDVMASYSIASMVMQLFPCSADIQYLIECKYTKKKPLIVFRSGGLSSAFYAHMPRTTHWTVNNKNFQFFEKLLTHNRDLLDRDFLIPDGPRCYGFTIFGGRDADQKGSKMRKPVKGLRVADDENNPDFFLVFQKLTSGAAAFASKGQRVVIPLLVVNGPLFCAGLDASGQTAVEQVNVAHLGWGASPTHPGETCIQIVTEDHLENYINSQLPCINALKAHWKGKESRLWPNPIEQQNGTPWLEDQRDWKIDVNQT